MQWNIQKNLVIYSSPITNSESGYQKQKKSEFLQLQSKCGEYAYVRITYMNSLKLVQLNLCSMSTGPALGLGHLGHRLGAPTRERPSNFGAKFDIFKKKKKLVLNFFFFNFKKFQRIE